LASLSHPRHPSRATRRRIRVGRANPAGNTAARVGKDQPGREKTTIGNEAQSYRLGNPLGKPFFLKIKPAGRDACILIS
jgi:hypothetical protein